MGRMTVQLAWNLQGRSPVLSGPGQSVEIFVDDLLKGKISVHLSKVGGLSITGPTGGLYDARYFNALVNPGDEPQRWMELLESDEAMDRVPECDAEFTQQQLDEWRESGAIEVVDDVDREAFRAKAEPHLRANFNPEQVEVLDAIRSVAE